jgi:glutamate N-acetyltransferase / amino-acid N-acetyltransferase
MAAGMKPVVCKGFKAAGIKAGIKTSGLKDLGLIYSERPAAVAGVFTRNFVKSPSVWLDMERVRLGMSRAVVVNSGNANCCNGTVGMVDARRMTALVAESLGLDEQSVLVASTGVIGKPMPMDQVALAIPKLVKECRVDGFEDLSEAIMTTDTVPKRVFRQGDLDGHPYTLLAVAKGAGMIRPDMATMLCFVCTDVAAEPGFLQKSLKTAVDRSLNRISIDGDTSTNDTALILANGASGARIQTSDHEKAFQSLLDEALIQVARDLVRDGEGVTKLVEVKVKGAKDIADAQKITDTIVHSPLVKTALFGEDANWGRIVAAAGRAGIPLVLEKMAVSFDDVRVFENGTGLYGDTEARATAVLKKPEFTITVDLGLGAAEYSMITCDFSIDYVKINADYRT